MDRISQAHLEYLRLRRCSASTIYNRQQFLRRIGEDIGVAPIDVTATQLYDWYAMQPRRMTARSQNTFLTNIRAFYRWAVSQGHRADDPSALLPRPICPPGRPRPMDTDDVLRCVVESRGRMHAAVVAAAYCGMRAIEIAQAERSWLTEEGTITIVGKGSRSRVVPAHHLVVEAFLRSESGRLFPCQTRPGQVARPGAVSQAVNKWLHQEMGIDDTLHSLRHWYGTQLYQATRDLRLVQDLMGHASPQTTAVYADYYRPDAFAAVASLPEPDAQPPLLGAA